MTAWSPLDIADRAANVLAPESGLLADPDVAQFGKALGRALVAAGTNPAGLIGAYARLATDLARIPAATLARWVGMSVQPPLAGNPKDRRFADQAGSDNRAWCAVGQADRALSRLSRDVIGAANLAPSAEGKARFAAALLLDALSPPNFLPTNPAAIKRAFDTGGVSLLRGARHFVDDLLHNNGRPQQVDTSPFRLGENLAATPAKVVYRNELMELLQYEPQTAQVHAAPLLCSPPWINKYYVMDLAPGRSFIEWAIKHNRTVFAISYLNPPPSMSRVTMDDYLIHGPQKALDVIQEITGADTIDIVGLCLGGAMTAIAAAYLTETGDSRLGTLTLLNTLLDYS